MAALQLILLIRGSFAECWFQELIRQVVCSDLFIFVFTPGRSDLSVEEALLFPAPRLPTHVYYLHRHDHEVCGGRRPEQL